MSSTSAANLITSLNAATPSFSPKLRTIAKMATENTERFIRNSSREICAELGVSEPTLIRFCQHFGHSGLSDFRIDLALSLAYQPRQADFIEPLPRDRRKVNTAAKQSIARKAAELVLGDASLLIDNGSTAELFAAALGDRSPLSVMTTGLVVAQNVLAHGRHQVMVTGGTIRPEALALTGRLVEASLKNMRFDTFVMSADSVGAAAGLSTYREEEAHDNRAMIASAARVIVLADHMKFSKPALHRICSFDDVAILVTDLPADASDLDLIREKGVEVHLAAVPHAS